MQRRSFLRGMAGSTLVGLVLPPLEAMLGPHGTAYADGTDIPRRLGLWFWGNGHSDRWRVRATAAGGWEPIGTDRTNDLAPLVEAGVHSEVSVLTGYQAHPNNISAHHVGRAVMLTGTWTDPNGTDRFEYGGPHGPSMTYHVAEQWEGLTPERSIDVGVCPGTSNGVYRPETGEVCDNSGNEQSADFDPRALYRRMFSALPTGTPAPSEPEPAPMPTPVAPTVDLTAVRRSALDAVLGDANALRARLGASDRHRLDAHLSGIRSIERRLQQSVGGGTTMPGSTGGSMMAAGATCVRPSEPGDAGSYQSGASSDRMAEKHMVLADMLAIGLACDLSRVFSMTFTRMQHNAVFSELGHRDGFHEITHENTTGDWEVEVHQGVRLAMQQFAYFVGRLRDTEIGATRLIDHCCVLATSEMEYDHGYDSMPILVAGTAGGALRRGVHVDSGGQVLSTNVLLTLIRAVGVEAAGFGDGEKRATQTVSALEA